MKPDGELAAHCLRKIFRTEEGAVLKHYLRHVALQAGPHDTCALHQHTGRRNFALELLKFAEEEIRDGSDHGSRERDRARPAAGPGSARRKRPARKGPELRDASDADTAHTDNA